MKDHRSKSRRSILGTRIGWAALVIELMTIAHYLIGVLLIDMRSSGEPRTGIWEPFTEISIWFFGAGLSFVFSTAAMVLSWRAWVCRISAFIAIIGVAFVLWLTVALSHLHF